MKNLKKPILLVLVLMLVLIGSMHFFGLQLIKTSTGSIPFEPGQTLEFANEYPEKPANIIIFIADGMGFNHLSLARLTGQTASEPAIWDTFEVRGWHDARSVYGPYTDSGASGTAMATGVSTNFEVIGMDAEGNSVENLMEKAQQHGYATGIVTDSYIWDATPAAFVAHTESRDNSREILTQIAASRLDLIFGELEDLGEDGNPDLDETMDILTPHFEMLDESLTIPETTMPLAAIFMEDQVQDIHSTPTLMRMVEVALNHLRAKDQPFVLIVESEEMDAASHDNNSDRVLRGLVSIQQTLSLLHDFAGKDGNTLLIFTADHETGGLAVTTSEGQYPNMALVWPSKEHSLAVVPLMATGPGSAYFNDVRRNRDIGNILKALIETPNNSSNEN